MVFVFVGALFVVLNFTIEFPSGAVLGLLPGFVGYILIHAGVDRLLQRETYLKYQMFNPIIALRFLIGLSALDWLTDLFFPHTEMGLPTTLLGLFLSILQVLLSVMFWVSFVRALEQVERERTVDLVTDYLMLAVVLLAAIQVLAVICALIRIEQFLVLVVLAGVGAVILFIIELFRAMRHYELCKETFPEA